MESDGSRDSGADAIAGRILTHPVLGGPPEREKIRFTYEGCAMEGWAGEPIAVALLASGVRVFRTMPRSGEARGGHCLIGRCSDCLMIVDGEPNVLACVTPLRDGMRVAVQRGLGAAVTIGDETKTGIDPSGGEA